MYRCRPWRAPERAAPAPAHLPTRAEVVPYQPDATARGRRPCRRLISRRSSSSLLNHARNGTNWHSEGHPCCAPVPPEKPRNSRRGHSLGQRGETGFSGFPDFRGRVRDFDGAPKTRPALDRPEQAAPAICSPSSFILPSLSNCEIRIVDFIFGISLITIRIGLAYPVDNMQRR